MGNEVEQPELSLGHMSLEERATRQRFSLGVRLLLVIVGTVAVGVGVLGIFLPLLPSTPFLLLAAGCYVRSSPRLYDRLINNGWTGRYIRNYREGRGMPRRAKIAALALLWSSLLFSAYLIPNLWIRLVLLSVGVGVPWLILSLPTLED